MTEVTEQPVATDEGNPSIASRMVSTIFRWLKLLCFAIGLGLIVIIGFLLIRGESADDVSTEQVAEASQPVAAPKPLDLTKVLHSGIWHCSTKNPNGSTSREQWTFSEDGTVVTFSDASDPLNGSYRVNGQSISLSFYVYGTTQNARIDVKDFSELAMNFNLVTRHNTRQAECNVNPY